MDTLPDLASLAVTAAAGDCRGQDARGRRGAAHSLLRQERVRHAPHERPRAGDARGAAGAGPGRQRREEADSRRPRRPQGGARRVRAAGRATPSTSRCPAFAPAPAAGTRSCRRWRRPRRRSAAWGSATTTTPKIETEFYNFDALNTPRLAPVARHARLVLHRPRAMCCGRTPRRSRCGRCAAQAPPPIRAMTAGRCYRRDEIDATHFPIFHQLDVIAIDRGISFGDLKWTLDRLLRTMLGRRDQAAVSSQLLPVHHAERRGRRLLPRPMDGAVGLAA